MDAAPAAQMHPRLRYLSARWHYSSSLAALNTQRQRGCDRWTVSLLTGTANSATLDCSLVLKLGAAGLPVWECYGRFSTLTHVTRDSSTRVDS